MKINYNKAKKKLIKNLQAQGPTLPFLQLMIPNKTRSEARLYGLALIFACFFITVHSSCYSYGRDIARTCARTCSATTCCDINDNSYSYNYDCSYSCPYWWNWCATGTCYQTNGQSTIGCSDPNPTFVLDSHGGATIRERCHNWCASCTDRTNLNCGSCYAPYYKMNQFTICETYCPTGNYSDTGYYGEYIVSTATRTCGACNTNCRFCLSNANNCYMCRSNAFLVDDNTVCQSRFPSGVNTAVASKTNCRKCAYLKTTFPTESCLANNNFCKPTSCPTYFYFETYYSNIPTSGTISVRHRANRWSFYTPYVNASTVSGAGNGLSGQTWTYRFETNLCILCDPKCTQCVGPMSTNCSSCANGYFKWTSQPICSQNCPLGEFEDHFNSTADFHDTQCKVCDARCIECTNFATNCSRCKGSQTSNNATFTGSSIGFLYVTNTTWSECRDTCPTSPNVNTTRGWYGSINNMVCYQCPGGCSNCNIDIVRAKTTNNIACSDIYCTNGLTCTSCLLGYILVAGKCIDQKNCKQYAYYLPGAVSTQWTPDKCFCHKGYWMSSYVTCTPCDKSCNTCNGPSNNNCLSCEQGYTLSSGSCGAGQSLRNHYYPSGTGSGQFYTSDAIQRNCSGHYTIFGYQKTTSESFGYQSDIITARNYYGYSVKMRVLFIDKWPVTGVIKIHDQSPTSQPVYVYSYDTYGALGQQACGTNQPDYVMTIYAEYKYVPTTNYVRFNVSSNANLFSPYPNWGIKDVIVTVLTCHADCATCKGPLATDCITCSDTTRVVVKNICTCNTAALFYDQDGTCRNTANAGTQCNPGYYRDTISAKCVLPTSCTPPKRFADPSTKYCVQDCPSGRYAQSSSQICVTNCVCSTGCGAAAYSEYKYNGAISGSCEDICPTNFIAYGPATTSLWQCVAKCPSGWYLALENRSTNPKCVDICPTGWQDQDLNECVMTCPNGYFRQLYNGQKRCMQKCYATFGLNSTGNCETSCPFPLFADPTTQLCQLKCPDPYLMQLSIATPINRTCVTICEVAQWANPIYKTCEKTPKNCPIGYYADNTTRKCVTSCNTVQGQVGQNSTQLCQTACTTGFAHWSLGICVSICPSNPSMFSYVSGSTRVCVSSCNASSTGLFADAQANRSCVATCSASPTPTFGEVSTSRCVPNCTVAGEFGDPLHPTRRCVTQCTQSPQTYSYTVTKMCLQVCPPKFFGDKYTSVGFGICASGCPSPYFADPISRVCIATCPAGYFGSPLTGRPCLQRCPLTYYGQNKTGNRLCVTQCDLGFYADEMTRLCTNVKAECSNLTYADYNKRQCVASNNCSTNYYSDPFTKGCELACSNTSYFGDRYTTSCVTLCSQVPEQYSEAGYCVNPCTGQRFADFQDKRKCSINCSRTPIALFGNRNTWKCVIPANCPTGFYADNLTLQCISPCTGSLPFGDPISRQCVTDCPDNYYGDWALNLCVQSCSNVTVRYADNITGNCEPVCTAPTYGTNSSTSPRCENQCPSGSFAKDGIRICVLDCGAGFYGDPVTRKCYSDPKSCSEGYYGNSVSNLCVLPGDCQLDANSKHFFAQNSTKTCVTQCVIPNYGDSFLWLCVPVCNNTHFGQNTTRQCLSGCSAYTSFAEKQNRLCVSRCSAEPIGTFAQNVTYTCVEPRACPTNRYAENNSRICVLYCPKTPSMTYADVYVTKRCVVNCPDIYYADNSILEGGQCVINCAGEFRFRENSTKSCINICPLSEATFGNSVGDMCVKTCPDGTYAQQDANRRCVTRCAANTWGNKITKICITNPVTECPPNTWADDSTNLCEQVCASTPSTYGYNVTRKCVTACVLPSYAFDPTRVCIDICPASLVDSGYFGDSDMTPTRKCVKKCSTAGLYRDIAASRQCKSTCTYNGTYKTYRDPTTMSCEALCSDYPQIRYADDLSQTCELACTNGGLKRSDKTRSCVATCPVLYEPNNNLCVEKCPAHSIIDVPLYADLTLKRCVQAADCPANTYASDDSKECVSTCPVNTYIHNKFCVYICPDTLFMDNVNRKCVSILTCPANTFADLQSRACVSKCNGNFADRTAKKCVDVCPASTYADSVTGFCETTCTAGFVINTGNNTCQSDCAPGLYKNPKNNSCSSSCVDPHFADDTSRSCVSVCTANPLTFSSTSNGRKCVGACSATEWHDLYARKCVTSCPSSTYAFEFNRSCLLFCPGPSHYSLGLQCVTNCSVQSKYADDTTRACVSTCPTGSWKDPTTFKCVTNCPETYFRSDSLNACTKNCPEGTYADQNDGTCVTSCSTSPPMFAEETYNVCVMQCPLSLSSFADYTTYRCVTECPGGYFTDNRTRQCKANCSGWFADSNKVPKACTTSCESGTFSDEMTFSCVGVCPKNYWGLDSNKSCVQFCPFGLFADNSTSKCVQKCPATHPYADTLTRMCSNSCTRGQLAFLAIGTTQWGSCVAVCPPNYFSNPLTKMCVSQCPQGYFSQTVNNTCTLTCPQNKFRDSVNRKCQTTCPAADNLYGNRFTEACVTACDPNLEIYADTLTRFCEQVCSGDQYKVKLANGTMACVSKTACPTGLYSDPMKKACVSECYNNTFGYNGICYPDCPQNLGDVLFANPITKTCVTSLNCPGEFFADSDQKRCVKFCDIANATFGDKDLKACVKSCASPNYADNSTRLCVVKCPDVPELFARQSDRVCVERCPNLKYANQLTNKCEDGCPLGYFADDSTWKCVLKCPEGKFGDNSTKKCVTTCPQSELYFGNPDPSVRECVKNCPNGTFADPANNRECKPYCLAPRFSQNKTNTCELGCQTGYSNERTQQCIAVCTTGYYGHAGICYKDHCKSVSPTAFADDISNKCVTKCPDGSFGDVSTGKCVKICPISENTFADLVNNLCVYPCIGDTYADNSTRRCVTGCPEVPQLFASDNEKSCLSNCTFGKYADNSTRKCVTVTQCPSGTYADNSTWKCVATCPSKPMMYGLPSINLCVLNCPPEYNRFAQNTTRTCALGCPLADNTFADSVSRTCIPTCPQGYFAVNSTRTCNLTCPEGQFADVLLRKCVAKCSVDPVYYGNRNAKECQTQCPSTAYGNPLTQECVFDVGGVSTCPDGFFADDTTRLCVKKCPMKQNLYGDPLSKKCVTQCSDLTYFKDNSTMLCVTKCPSYPNYFANLATKSCVAFCPAERWADDATRVCESVCTNNTFAENTTWRCLPECLKSPLTFSDTTTSRCVSQCPNNWFADNLTFTCVQKCPETDNTFAENITKKCVKNCPSGTFAQNTTRICVSTCWNEDVADNSSKKCVKRCPTYPSFYAYFTDNVCVSTCPQKFFAFEKERTCVAKCPEVTLYRQNTTRKCVENCIYELNEYADDLTGYCVSRCSVDTWADPTTRKCVSKCPNQPLMYSANDTQTCVSTCPAPWYGQNETLSCVVKCPTNSLSFEAKRLCVRYCPIGYFAYTQTAFCVETCPEPFYGDPSTRTCVLECPLIQLLYAENVTRQCVKKCPPMSYADKRSKFCVRQCPLANGQQRQTYAADYNNVCVEECSLPTFSYEPSLRCFTKCPDPYYSNVTDHKCYQCPGICTSCTSPTACNSCISKYYLQNGQCVLQCTGLYYANITSMKCVLSTQCKPYFGVNATNMCSQFCPTNQWHNTNQYRCDACPSTCETCTSLTNCKICKETAVFFENFCYGFCSNATAKYYSRDNKTCLSACNNGTYLSVLFCKPCDASCTTCSGISTNCTLCSGGMYLQDQVCVSSCSTGYKPTADLMCTYCGDDCGAGLTFGTNVTTIDGQANVFINFNSDINVLGNLYDVFQVQSRRRLLIAYNDHSDDLLKKVGEGTTPPPYKIQVVDGKTIRIIFPPGYSAADYQIQIAKPEKIQDEFGNIPANTRPQITQDTSDLYSTNMDNVRKDFTTYFKIIAILAIVGFIFDTEMLKFLQLIYMHYFVAMNLPPEISKLFIEMSYSTVDYIPSIYPIQEAVLKTAVSGKVYDLLGDYSFLRTAASSVTVIIVMVLVFLILKALSLPEINKSKTARLWVKNFIDEKWTFGIWIEMLLIMYVNTVFMAALQMRDYNMYDNFATASIAMAHIVLLACLVVIGFIIFKVAKFFNDYPKLSENLKKASDIIMQDEDFKMLNSANIFLFEKKKIDLRNLMYPKVNNENILPFKCIYRFNFFALFAPAITMLRVLLLSFIISFGPNTVIQMAIAIPLNLLALMYFAKAKPYSFKERKYRIKNYIAIYNEACLIIFEGLMLGLGLLQKNAATPTEKQTFSLYIIYFLTAVSVPNVIYFVFRCVVHVYRKMWLPFIESDLFRTNFPEKWAYYQALKNKENAVTKKIDPIARQAIKTLLKGFKENFSLRPTNKDKQNPQLPVKHKITFFDRDGSSSVSSGTTMSRKQKKSMLKELFAAGDHQIDEKQVYEEVKKEEEVVEGQSEVEYEEYEEEFEVKVKDLSKYVANAEEILKMLRNRDESDTE